MFQKFDINFMQRNLTETNLIDYGVSELDLFIKTYHANDGLRLAKETIHVEWRMFKRVLLNNYMQVAETKVVFVNIFKQNQLFPNLITLYDIVYCLAPTSAACEKMFSRMNLVKMICEVA